MSYDKFWEAFFLSLSEGFSKTWFLGIEKVSLLQTVTYSHLSSNFLIGSVAEGFILEASEEDTNDAFISTADLAYNRVPNCVSSRAANRILAAGNWRNVIKYQGEVLCTLFTQS